MPIYEYKCTKCDAAFEKMTTMAKADETECANCGSDETERQFSTFGVAVAQPASPCSGGGCPMPSGGAPSPCQGCPSAGMM
ncbi:hypothetical protein BVY04_03195 [bacterium M21]|nr:hypothetical protein BVY04_03195 [bacterium M21]